jgi:hypothetical protein
MTAWTDHVRSMASQLGLTYMCASTDPRVKNSYNKAPRVSKPLTDEQKKRRRAARLIKIGNNALSLNPVPSAAKAKRDAKKAEVAAKFEAFWNRQEGIPAGGPLAGSGVRTASLATIAQEAAAAGKQRKKRVKVKDAVSEFLTGAITDATLRQGMADADREIIDIANAMGASGNAPLSIPSLDAMMMGGVSSSAPKKKRAKPGKGKQTVPFYLKPGGRKKPKKDSKMKPPKPPTTFTPLSAEEMAFHANLLG